MQSEIIPMLTYENGIAAMGARILSDLEFGEPGARYGWRIWKASDGCLCKGPEAGSRRQEASGVRY